MELYTSSSPTYFVYTPEAPFGVLCLLMELAYGAGGERDIISLLV